MAEAFQQARAPGLLEKEHPVAAAQVRKKGFFRPV